MRQGQRLAGALALAAFLVAAHGRDVVAATTVHASPRAVQNADSPSTEPKSSRTKSGNQLHQFTCYVSAVDKTTITVQKRGKKPRSMVFVKHDEMKVSGDLEKDARVTVYYKDDGGRAVAHRVVTKPEGSSTKRSR